MRPAQFADVIRARGSSQLVAGVCAGRAPLQWLTERGERHGSRVQPVYSELSETSLDSSLGSYDGQNVACAQAPR